jgi:polyisoprenoid-binding protein YceI
MRSVYTAARFRWIVTEKKGFMRTFTLVNRPLGLFLMGLCLLLPSNPLQAQQLNTSTAPTKPGAVNLEFSRVYIFVDKSGVAGHQHAVEGKVKSGELFTQSSRPGTIVFDMKSFDADTPTARKYIGLEGETDAGTRKKVNENMLGVEILSVNKYPEARLENAVLKSTGKTSKRKLPEYTLEGDFVLHDTKRHIEIRCDVETRDGWNHVRGGFKILQSDYGIKPFSKMLGAVGVKDELTILGDFWMVPDA